MGLGGGVLRLRAFGLNGCFEGKFRAYGKVQVDPAVPQTGQHADCSRCQPEKPKPKPFSMMLSVCGSLSQAQEFEIVPVLKHIEFQTRPPGRELQGFSKRPTVRSLGAPKALGFRL